MKKCPIAVTVIAVLLALTGAAGLIGDLLHLKSIAAEHYETIWIAVIHALAIVSGAFMLVGRNWARWLALAWMAFHVAISFGHPLQQLLIHAALLLLFIWILFFLSEARAWFGSSHSTT